MCACFPLSFHYSHTKFKIRVFFPVFFFVKIHWWGKSRSLAKQSKAKKCWIKRTNPIMKWEIWWEISQNGPSPFCPMCGCFASFVRLFDSQKNEQQKISPKQIFLFWQPKKCDSGNSGSLSFSKSSIITVFCCACSICPIFLNREKKNSKQNNENRKSPKRFVNEWTKWIEMKWNEWKNQTKGDYGDYI